ncbi:MAG: transcriptional regulator [Candidatus Binatia bacterium]
MQAAQPLTFGSYHFDPHTGQLWRGKQEVKPTGKAFAVLRYVIARAGQVVTKEELFQAVWPETVVSEAALTSCIQELRRALHDNARKPHYIAMVHRRGFQFIGNIVRCQPSVDSRKKGVGDWGPGAGSSPQPPIGTLQQDVEFERNLYTPGRLTGRRSTSPC